MFPPYAVIVPKRQRHFVCFGRIKILEEYFGWKGLEERVVDVDVRVLLQGVVGHVQQGGDPGTVHVLRRLEPFLRSHFHQANEFRRRHLRDVCV